MPTATKQVRFSSTNTLYSLTSPQRLISTKINPPTKTPSSSSSSRRRSSSTRVPLQDIYAPMPSAPALQDFHLQPAPRPFTNSSRSSSSRSSSSRSSSRGTPSRDSYALPLASAPATYERHGLSTKDLHLHVLLAFAPTKSGVVKYNLSFPPSFLTEQYRSSSLLETATNPPVATLTIICPHLNWPIVVTPTPLLSTPYVTVFDVLTCLYRSLRTTVHQQEYDSLGDGGVKRNVDQAYFNRVAQIGDSDARNDEAKKGVKRIDFLMGKNLFLGLSGMREQAHLWQLNVS